MLSTDRVKHLELTLARLIDDARNIEVAKTSSEFD